MSVCFASMETRTRTCVIACLNPRQDIDDLLVDANPVVVPAIRPPGTLAGRSAKGRENKCFPAGMLACRPAAPKRPGDPGNPILAIDRLVSSPTGQTEFTLPRTGFAGRYASALLDRVGVESGRAADWGFHADEEREPQLAWARSGTMALSGHSGAAPLLAPAPLASAANGALASLRVIAGQAWRGGEIDAASLLAERSAIFGYTRRGEIAPGGSCRLIEASDGWLAVNLARESDRALVPAWLEVEVADDLWSAVEKELARGRAKALLARARLMSLPVAPASNPVEGAWQDAPWATTTHRSEPCVPQRTHAPVVLDLSSLWAGPLCTNLLGLAGARVIKLESLERPDGARRGPQQFYDVLNEGKESVAIELGNLRGRTLLERLIERADIVVESARPRALAQLGIVAEEWIARKPGLTWLSITGYGRTEPEAEWVAFGDDASAAAGLPFANAMFNHRGESDELRPVFCGDAISDPLTGLHAATAALGNWRSGGSALIDISLRGVVGHLLSFGGIDAEQTATVEQNAAGEYEVRIGDRVQVVEHPRSRVAKQPARELGADTAATLESLGVRE